ncbi:MAG: outer membrane protein transport protein, partial [Paludibacteraceae bacterium]|nr:outer membrane protein transport protein [Paludibacteraceae bacterium]
TNDSRTHVPFNHASFIIGYTNKDKSKGVVGNNFGFSYSKLKDFHRNMAISAQNQSSSMTDYLAEYTNNSEFLNGDFKNLGDYGDLRNGYLSSMAWNAYLINPKAIGDTSSIIPALAQGETVNPEYLSEERGYLNEYTFSYGMNISNMVYWGVSMGVQDLYYSRETRYQETFGNNYGALINYTETKGTGVNFNAGVIVKPIDQLRLGVAVHSPTLFTSSEDHYGVNDYLNSQMVSTIGNNDYYTAPNKHDEFYEILSPWKYNFSIAGVLGHRGLISVDYQIADYNTMKIREDGGRDWAYRVENNNIKDKFQASHSLRVGAEVNVIDGLFLRCGYAFVTSPFADKDNVTMQLPSNTTYTSPEFFVDRWTNYYSAGLGYHKGFWYVDLSYQLKQQDFDFYAYDYTIADAPANGIKLNKAELTSLIHNVSISAGVKF